MIGVLCVEQIKRVNLKLPVTLIQAIHTYRATLVPRPHLNFTVAQLCVEALRAHGIEVHPETFQGPSEAKD